jgi:hypothetical protein
MRRFENSPAALIVTLIVVNLTIAVNAISQSSGHHCDKGLCVPWSGPAQCSTDLECRAGNTAVSGNTQTTNTTRISTTRAALPQGSTDSALNALFPASLWQELLQEERRNSQYFLQNLSGIPVAKEPGPLQLLVGTKQLIHGSEIETDLGAVYYKEVSPKIAITFKNASTVAMNLISLTPSLNEGILSEGFRTGVLAAGASRSISVSMITARSGVKTARYILRYTITGSTKVENFLFEVGGIVWPTQQEAKDNRGKVLPCPQTIGASVFPVASPSPTATMSKPSVCPVAAVPVNPNFKALGSEELALARVKNDTEFYALYPKLTLSSAELLLKRALPRNDTGDRILKLVVISNRLFQSRGAVIALQLWSPQLLASRSLDFKKLNPRITNSEAQQLISQEILLAINPILNGSADDRFGQARSQLIIALSNIKELTILNRLWSGVTLARRVENISRLNAMGRYYLRSALFRSYLSTNPPLTEANRVLAPVLNEIKDTKTKEPLAKIVFSQYPEVWAAVQ